MKNSITFLDHCNKFTVNGMIKHIENDHANHRIHQIYYERLTKIIRSAASLHTTRYDSNFSRDLSILIAYELYRLDQISYQIIPKKLNIKLNGLELLNALQKLDLNMRTFSISGNRNMVIEEITTITCAIAYLYAAMLNKKVECDTILSVLFVDDKNRHNVFEFAQEKINDDRIFNHGKCDNKVLAFLNVDTLKNIIPEKAY